MRLRESAQAAASRLHAEVLSGRYRLDEPLGSGGAADVYRGFDLRMRRPVAVKVFRSDACLDAEESWRGEAVILARLHHPGLVTAFDAGHHDGHAFLVMQLVEGTTLKNHIAEGPLPPDDVAALGADLARALAHAHEAGIVHRDVKPSNILLDPARRPYLADFGISRPLDATTRTAADTLVGTAAYLSPEQVLGRSVGRPADIYALGLVLLECLTGRLEYGGGPVEAAIARLHRPPALPLDAPEQFRALLGRMTDKDDEARPTAGECARALTALAGTAPTTAGPRVSALLGAEPRPAGAEDRTHPGPVRAGDTTRGTRGRTVMAGGGVALAAVAAVVLAVTGSSAPSEPGPGAPPASSARAESPHARNDGGERGTTSTRPPTARSTGPHAGAGTPAADRPGPGTSAAPSDRPRASATGSGPDGSTHRASPPPSPAPTPSKASPTAPATPGEGTTSAPATPSGTATGSPWQPPGQAKRTEPARDGEGGRAG